MAMVATVNPNKSFFFYFFLSALVVNSLYPFVLLNASSRWWRRDAVAVVDILLVRVTHCALGAHSLYRFESVLVNPLAYTSSASSPL